MGQEATFQSDQTWPWNLRQIALTDICVALVTSNDRSLWCGEELTDVQRRKQGVGWRLFQSPRDGMGLAYTRSGNPWVVRREFDFELCLKGRVDRTG